MKAMYLQKEKIIKMRKKKTITYSKLKTRNKSKKNKVNQVTAVSYLHTLIMNLRMM